MPLGQLFHTIASDECQLNTLLPLLLLILSKHPYADDINYQRHADTSDCGPLVTHLVDDMPGKHKESNVC